ncbi:MAG: YfhO family protein [Candidatus Roizmanbacteria bacterium]|nr:YfhO family protein [Candidatus Roizmanbacteria bacterium]
MYHMIHKFLTSHISLNIGLWIVAFLFFIRLFIPDLHVFYIPDYAISDLFNVNYALKDYLSQTLKTNSLPFISPLESHGYPLLAESQIGALNLLNLVLYRFLPPALAFNLTYPISLGILGTGMYLLTTLFSRRKDIAFFCAVSYMFSGIVLYEIVHQGIFQAIAFIPITTYFLFAGIRGNSAKYMVLAGFMAAQQFLFGHFFVSMAQQLLVLICVFYFIFRKKFSSNLLMLFFWYGSIFILVSLPQLVQSAIFTTESSRQGAITRGMFPPELILSLFTPFPFGNLLTNPTIADRFGAYNASPWEANLFMGYGSVLIGFTLLFSYLRKTVKITFPTILVVLLIVMLIFMLGDVPILKSLTRIGVFNSIRSIYRMCIFVVFVAIILIGISADTFKLSKPVILVAIALQILGGFYHFYGYFPLISEKTVYQTPLIKKYLKPNEALVGVGFGRMYKKKLIEQGYQRVEDYLPLNAALEPHTQLIPGIARCDGFYYSLYNPTRLQFFISNIYVDRMLGMEKTVEKRMESYLQLLGCNTVASPYPLTYNKPRIINSNLYLYTVPRVLPDFLLTHKVEFVLNEQDLLRKLGNGEYDPSTVYTSYPLLINRSKTQGDATLTVVTNDPHTIQFQTQSKTEQLLYVRRLWYPGWHAYINGNQEMTIRRANILFMAVSVPSGNHQVDFVYTPPYWFASVVGSLIGYVMVFLFVVLFRTPHSNTKIFQDFLNT